MRGVVDKSAAFRMEPDVPLVIAEVNPDDLRDLPRGIVSSPNCTTTVPLMALAPLHRAAGIRRMVVSSYQSVSGAGQPGITELDEQWTKGAGHPDRFLRAGTGELEAGSVWKKPIAGNVIPQAGSIKEFGYTSEEWKMAHETRKILHAPEIRVTATCVRVPVYVGHGVAANVEFERPLVACRRDRDPARRARGAARRRRRRRAHADGRRGHRPDPRGPRPRRPVAGRTRSTSGPPATTSARAPRSTASSSPSYSLEV